MPYRLADLGSTEADGPSAGAMAAERRFSTQDDLRTAVFTSPDELSPIEDQWRALPRDTADFSAAQTIDYATSAWAARTDPSARFRVVTVWRADRLVCVWPLVIRRAWGASIATHPGRGGDEEYAGPLILPGPDAGRIARVALRAAKAQADVLRIFNVRADGPIGAALQADDAMRCRTEVKIELISCGAWPDTAAWLGSKSRSFRFDFGRYRRRLAGTGDLRFERVSGVEPVRAFLAWMFERKLDLVDRLGVRDSWIRAPAGRALFERLLTAQADTSHMVAYALTVDGRIAAGVVGFRTQVLELAMIAYDQAFAAFSPGAVLLGYCVDLAIALGVDIDFRFGGQPYKKRWADRVETRSSYRIAASLAGAPSVLSARANEAVRALRRRLGPPIKRILRR